MICHSQGKILKPIASLLYRKFSPRVELLSTNPSPYRPVCNSRIRSRLPTGIARINCLVYSRSGAS